MRIRVIHIFFSMILIGIFLLYLSSQYNIDILKTIATILIPSSMVAILYQYLIRKTFLKELKDSMNLVIDEKFEPISNLNKSGITDCYENLSSENLKKLLRQCEDKIRICKSFLPSFNEVDSELASAIKRGVKVEFCLTHPDSDFSKYRNNVLKRREGFLSNMIRTSHSNLEHFKGKHGFDDNQIIIKMHSEFLPVSYHQFDNKILIGMLLSGTLANKNPIINVEGISTPIFKTLKEHYDSIWENATLV